MQHAPGISVAIALLCFCPTALLRAELLSQALLSFPASTRSLEYDNLAQLRRLPTYETLRQQYSGASLERVKSTFSKLGITEESIQEIVSGSGPSDDLYGIVSGIFNGLEVSRRAAGPGVRKVPIGNKRAQCSSAGVCVMFLENWMAAFGQANTLQEMLQTRLGTSARLSATTQLGELLAKADPRAPVIGVAPGSDLSSWIRDSIPKGLLSQANLAKLLENISWFQYSVRLDQKAHLNLNLECTSTLTWWPCVIGVDVSVAVVVSGPCSCLAKFDRGVPGGSPTEEFNHLTPSGINLQSGHIFHAGLTWQTTSMTLNIT